MKILFFSLLSISLACADTPEHESLVAVVRGYNTFAFETFKKLDQGKNLFISPYSLSSALTLSHTGAKGKTADEIAKVLHLPKDPEKLKLGLTGLKNQINGDGSPRGFSLSTANALWLQEGMKIIPSFAEESKNRFDAEARNLDFAKHTEDSRQTINKWVEDKTNLKIKDLIPSGSLSPQSLLVITNAVYFKGEWQTRFDKNLTKKDSFFVTPKKKVSADFMVNLEERNYLDQPSFSLTALPYKRSSLSMVLILPKKKDGLKEVEKLITGDKLASWMPQVAWRRVLVSLPKVKLTSTYKMEDIFSSMGMPTAFTEAADFSGIIADKKISVSSILHKTFVDVDEWGTEAAAATGMIFKATAMMTDKPVELKFDHPYLFLIYDNESGIILFMGRIQNPAEQ